MMQLPVSTLIIVLFLAHDEICILFYRPIFILQIYWYFLPHTF